MVNAYKVGHIVDEGHGHANEIIFTVDEDHEDDESNVKVEDDMLIAKSFEVIEDVDRD